jgi:hypothetical protein
VEGVKIGVGMAAAFGEERSLAVNFGLGGLFRQHFLYFF